MSKRLTYLLAAILAMLAEITSAQNCPRGMLTIGGTESYVATPGVQALNLTHGFTIECWVKPTGIVPNSGIIDKGHGSFSAYGIFVDTGSEYFGLVRRTSPVRLAMMPMDSFYNWHHIAFVFRPGDSMYLYIDSVEAASASTKTISTLDSSADSLRIGMSAAGVGFLGSIDELRIWNAPLSLATIRAHSFN